MKYEFDSLHKVSSLEQVRNLLYFSDANNPQEEPSSRWVALMSFAVVAIVTDGSTQFDNRGMCHETLYKRLLDPTNTKEAVGGWIKLDYGILKFDLNRYRGPGHVTNAFDVNYSYKHLLPKVLESTQFQILFR